MRGGTKERGKLDPDLAFYGVPAVEPTLSPLERADMRAQRRGMRPLIDEDLAHLGIPAAYTWHIPITEWNALMKALHGNGMSKGKQKRATGKKAHGQAHFATLNVCGGGLESIEGVMEEIRELRVKGSAPIRNTGREATKKLAEIIRYIKEGGVWLTTLADTHLGEEEMREVIEYLETQGIEACGDPSLQRPGRARAQSGGVDCVGPGPPASKERREGRSGHGGGGERSRREGGDGGRGKRTGMDTDRGLHASEGAG